MGYPKLSYATYRLKILTPPGQVYLLHIPEIMSSSLIWINGEEFYGAGTVGGLDADTVTGVRNELLAAASPNGTLELVAKKAVGLAGNRTYLVPVILFLVTGFLSAIGPGNIPVGALMTVVAVTIEMCIRDRYRNKGNDRKIIVVIIKVAI